MNPEAELNPAARPNESAKAAARRKFKRMIWLLLGIVALLFVMLIVTLFGPSTPIVVSKKTTHITEPLDANGNVDYFEALREMQRDGVTVENNAAVLLWQAFGTRDLDPDDVEPFFAELGIPVPPEDGEYLRNTDDETLIEDTVRWIREQRAKTAKKIPDENVNDAESEGLEFELPDLADKLITEAYRRPWTNDDFPPLVAWLDHNSVPTDLAFEASKRLRMYAPMLRPGPDDEYGTTLVALMLPTAQNSRLAARALAIRSMWRLGNGDVDGAWDDALACHRLARLISEGRSLLAQLVAAAIDGIGFDLTKSILETPLTPRQAARIRDDLSNLGPCVDMARSIDTFERMMFLDEVSNFASNKQGGEYNEVVQLIGKSSIDWNVPMEMGNAFFDEIVAAARHASFADREPAVRRVAARVDAQLDANNGMEKQPMEIVSMIFSRRQRSEWIGEAFLLYLAPITELVVTIQDRAQSNLALSQAASHLAVYRAEHGEYPDALADLGEDVVAKLPNDLFTERPFIYRRTDDGYILISAGANQQDDGGSNEMLSVLEGFQLDDHDDPAVEKIPPGADDYAFRIPRPPFDWAEFAAAPLPSEIEAAAVEMDDDEEPAKDSDTSE